MDGHVGFLPPLEKIPSMRAFLKASLTCTVRHGI